VLALVILYFLHSAALLALPRRNPQLFASVTGGIGRPTQRVSAIVSMIAMAGLIALQAVRDARVLATTSFGERLSNRSLTSLELVIFWTALGLVMYAATRKGRQRVSG